MKRLVPVALGAALVASATTTEYCARSGAVLPPPILRDPGDFNPASLNDALNQLIAESSVFDVSDTSFSVTVTTPEEIFFEFHHTAPQINETGVTEVNADTVYRVASVTKLFTTLSAMLQQGLDLDSLIWEHVPELVGVEQFKEVSLRLLASHLSGVTRDGWVFDWSARASPDDLAALGLPDTEPPADYPLCDALGAPQCTRAQFLHGLTRGQHVWLPGNTPAYSNYAFPLLGLAVESFTNKTYPEVVRDSITRPLEMSPSTGFEFPGASKMVIPIGGEEWAEVDPNYWKATGGLYSTPNDLSRLARGILNHVLMTAAQTAEWLKPRAYTSSSTGNGVGMPWYVIRPVNVPRPSGARPLEVYALAGSIPSYAAYIAVIPEYRVGFTINVAGSGDDPATKGLLDLAVQHVVLAFDTLARAQAEKYVGSYTDGSSDPETEDSILLVLDDGPGLKVAEWLSNGKNVSEAWIQLRGGSSSATDVDIRAYPIGDGSNSWQVSFKANADRGPTSIFLTGCDTWFEFGEFRYNGVLAGQFDFVLNEDGSVAGVQVPGLVQNLTHSA